MADIKVTVDAAHKAGIDVPTLCYLRDINEIGACRMCVCEVVGARALVAACVYPCTDGMVAYTNTEKIKDYRRKTLQLILSDHDQDCLGCVRSTDCELQALCKRYGVEKTDYYAGVKNEFAIDASSASIVRETTTSASSAEDVQLHARSIRASALSAPMTEDSLPISEAHSNFLSQRQAA